MVASIKFVGATSDLHTPIEPAPPGHIHGAFSSSEGFFKGVKPDDVLIFAQSILNDDANLWEPPGWTRAITVLKRGGPHLQARIFYRVVTDKEPEVYFFNPQGNYWFTPNDGYGTTSFPFGTVLHYRGIKPDKPFDRLLEKNIDGGEEYVCPDAGNLKPNQIVLYAVAARIYSSFLTEKDFSFSPPYSFWSSTWYERFKNFRTIRGNPGFLVFDGSGDSASTGPKLTLRYAGSGQPTYPPYLAIAGAVINPDDGKRPELVSQAFVGWGVPMGLGKAVV